MKWTARTAYFTSDTNATVEHPFCPPLVAQIQEDVGVLALEAFVGRVDEPLVAGLHDLAVLRLVREGDGGERIALPLRRICVQDEPPLTITSTTTPSFFSGWNSNGLYRQPACADAGSSTSITARVSKRFDMDFILLAHPGPRSCHHNILTPTLPAIA